MASLSDWINLLASFIQVLDMIWTLIGGLAGVWVLWWKSSERPKLRDIAIVFALGSWIFYVIGSFLGSWSMHEAQQFNRRTHVTRHVIEQALAINDAVAKYGIRGPYAHHLKVKDVRRFQRKAAILLNHVNLLRSIYAERDILGETIEKAYLNWARTIVAPWIVGDQDLTAVWLFLKTNKDLIEPGFFDWIKDSILIPEKR